MRLLDKLSDLCNNMNYCRCMLNHFPFLFRANSILFDFSLLAELCFTISLLFSFCGPGNRSLWNCGTFTYNAKM